MAESSLSLQLSDLAIAVGGYLGFGRTNTAWTGWQAALPYVPSSPDSQLGWIMECIQAGLRRFYWPRVTDAGPIAHAWSFLAPQRQLVIQPGINTYDMPDDFGGIRGEFTYQATDSTWLTVKTCGIGEVERYLQTLFGVQNKPVRAAFTPKQSQGTSGQRFQVTFAPTPDNQYTLTYTSVLLPSALSATNPYPYGGAAHGETILESCLGIAEQRFQDEAQGPHDAAFQRLLQASITVDVRDNKPAYMGYNGDRSDRRGGGYFGVWLPWQTETTGATYNGQQF